MLLCAGFTSEAQLLKAENMHPRINLSLPERPRPTQPPLVFLDVVSIFSLRMRDCVSAHPQGRCQRASSHPAIPLVFPKSFICALDEEHTNSRALKSSTNALCTYFMSEPRIGTGEHGSDA